MAGRQRAEEPESSKRHLIYPRFMNNQLDVLLNKVSDSQFGEIYDCLSKSNKPWKGRSKVFTIFKDIVRKNARRQFEDISNTVKLDEKMALVDDLSSKYSSKKDTIQWRPNGDVEQALISHDMTEKLKRMAHLQKVIERETEEVKILKSELDNICSLLKSDEELDNEVKRVNDEISIEREFFLRMRHHKND